jgi:hypothetical protein
MEGDRKSHYQTLEGRVVFGRSFWTAIVGQMV